MEATIQLVYKIQGLFVVAKLHSVRWSSITLSTQIKNESNHVVNFKVIPC